MVLSFDYVCVHDYWILEDYFDLSIFGYIIIIIVYYATQAAHSYIHKTSKP